MTRKAKNVVFESEKLEANTEQGREFFKFSGAYRIAPDTSAEDMSSDAACFLDSAEAITNKLIDGFGHNVSLEDQSMIFAIRHFVTMAKNLCMAAHEELEAASREGAATVEAHA
jgi:hypothetical protein